MQIKGDLRIKTALSSINNDEAIWKAIDKMCSEKKIEDSFIREFLTFKRYCHEEPRRNEKTCL